jgi:2-C-methyl-D-erythritol 2,4-cyclodiphosphate synthase
VNKFIERLSDKARSAQYWSFVAAIREKQDEIGPIHFVMGIQCANPQVFAGASLAELGFAPLDVHDVEGIQQEMQKRMMATGIARAKSGASEEKASMFLFPYSPKIKGALELATRLSESLGARSVGTPHLLYAISKSDVDVAERLARANLGEGRVLELCRQYSDEDEGESMSQALGKMRRRSSRSGIGYDLHRLAEGRKLIVGGVELPFDKGPVGHSDGDVLAHALCDALLGAAGLGDIGTHFPDTDPKWKGANSLLFLEHAKKLLDAKGFLIEWVDAVVITEKPKLGPHFPRMREALAGALGVSVDHIHLKAKTNEGVDAVGRGEAIAAYVVATLVGQ